MTPTAVLVARALRAAGLAEARAVAGRNLAGFFAINSGPGTAVIAAILGDDQEGHPDSPGCHAVEARMTGSYREALEAAGWTVRVDRDWRGLTVTGPAKVACHA